MKCSLLLIIIISSFVAHETYATLCTSDPCNNGGTCYTGDSSYICVCPSKYSGQNCDIYQDDFDYSITPCTPTTCSNGGTCFTGPHGSYFCACTSGFSGTQCERETGTDVISTTSAPSLTPCTSSPCSNGGTCYTGTQGSFFCSCPSGFTGTHCETVATTVPPYAVNYCSSIQCANGGTCYTGRTEFICTCPAGFAGQLCETQLFCSSNPCRNGGTCYTGVSSYTCVCSSGYTGKHCETVACSSDQPCQNGGSCEVMQTNLGADVFLCTCPEAYRGPHCETLASCIDDAPCQNDGTCIPTGVNGTDTMCVCRENFYGVRCELQIDMCSTDPCMNGGTCFTSSENRAAFVCSCPHGFEGSLCEHSDPCADNPCQNGGVCSHPLDPANDMVMCQCTNGFVGVRCEIVDTGVGACVTGACMNGGTCVPSPFAVGGLSCTCPASHTGGRCEQEIPRACGSNPCLYGAVCDDVGDGNYQCICLEGYAGRRCEQIGPCVSSPCMNGGICVEDVYNPGNLSCQCRNQYTGTTCTIPPQEDPCNSSPCQNGGTCIPTSEGTSYQCDCPNDFVGLTCDNPDPCSPSPCQNSGVCNAIPVTGGNWAFYCVCTDQFLGLTCSAQRACVSNPCLHGGQCIDVPESASQPLYGTELTSEMLNYNCRCLDGWTGQNCETEINDPCESNPCHNNGTCFRSHSANRFFCSCPVGFYGSFCDADPCVAGPCKNNATCQSVGSQYTCICNTGYLGVDCTVEDPCHTNPCINGGMCRLTDTWFECSCLPGFVGSDCSQQDPCFLRPCLNGGTCMTVERGVANTVEYQCLCPLGYGGLTCGVNFGDVNKCVLNLCENGGSCYQGSDASSGSYICVCTRDYEGDNCNTRIPDPLGATQIPEPCSPDPCLNGGRCYVSSSDESSYICRCEDSFTGVDCETAVPTPTPTPIPSGCDYGDQTYTDGQMRQDGCKDCTCHDGDWSCTNERCMCTSGSQTYNNGESWEVGCLFCSCLSGVVSCADMNCRNHLIDKQCTKCLSMDNVKSGSFNKNGCLHESVIYEPGTSRTDNCNMCVCTMGAWECTDNSCGKICTYMNAVYLANEDRKDDCNICSCLRGEWICTERACNADPIVIKVEFDFSNDFSDVTDKQEEFIGALKQNLLMLLRVQESHIQNITISEGSIKVKLNLVENKEDNVNIETVAVVLDLAISKNSYSFNYDGQQYQSDPNSFKMVKQGSMGPTPGPSDGSPNLLIIIIAVVACGVLGLLIVTGSVCWLVKRHASTRDMTVYGTDALPRASDNTSWDGIENEGYDRDRTTSKI